MSTGNKQEPPDKLSDDPRQAQTPPGGRPLPGQPLTIEDVRARLSEGLRPGEDILFYDMDRFGERRPAQPSEREVYEPPRKLAGVDECATPSDAEKVVLQVSGNTAPPDLGITQSIGPTENSPKENVFYRAGRARTKDIAYAFFVVSAVSVMGLWFLIWQRESDAHRKVPSALVTPSVVLSQEVKTESLPTEGPAVPLIDDHPPAPASTAAASAPSVAVLGTVNPRSSSEKARVSPKTSSTTKRAPRPTVSAEPTAVDPNASVWIHQER